MRGCVFFLPLLLSLFHYSFSPFTTMSIEEMCGNFIFVPLLFLSLSLSLSRPYLSIAWWCTRECAKISCMSIWMMCVCVCVCTSHHHHHHSITNRSKFYATICNNEIIPKWIRRRFDVDAKEWTDYFNIRAEEERRRRKKTKRLTDCRYV